MNLLLCVSLRIRRHREYYRNPLPGADDAHLHGLALTVVGQIEDAADRVLHPKREAHSAREHAERGAALPDTRPEATLNDLTNAVSADELHASLRRVHRSILVSLALCALVIWTLGASDAAGAAGEPGRHFTFAAFGLAAASILVRRTGPVHGLAPRYFKRALASYVLAAGVGAIGVAAAASGPLAMITFRSAKKRCATMKSR